MKRHIAAAVFVFVSFGDLIAQAPKAGAADPSLGTWALNVQRSKLPGPPQQAFIEKYELRPDGFIISTRSVIAGDGTPSFEQAAFKYDGKDYEWWDSTTLAEFLASRKRTPKTLSVKAVDAYTVEYAGKQAGKTIVTGKRTVSKDGKTMTFTAKVLDPQGKWIDVEGVFEKK